MAVPLRPDTDLPWSGHGDPSSGQPFYIEFRSGAALSGDRVATLGRLPKGSDLEPFATTQTQRRGSLSLPAFLFRRVSECERLLAEQAEARAAQAARDVALFDGLPRDTSFNEAVKIKARLGNAYAKARLHQMNSRAYRLVLAQGDHPL